MSFKIVHFVLIIVLIWGLGIFYLTFTSLTDSGSRCHGVSEGCVCPSCPEYIASSQTCAPISTENTKKAVAVSQTTPFTTTTQIDHGGRHIEGDDPSWGEHRLAVLVPFRDRFEELLEFAPHLHQFLNRQRVRHRMYVINQIDSHRFNRASLLNIGFLLGEKDGCDYIAMHDIDLLPLNNDVKYSYPEKGPFHVSAPHLHPLYHYETFVGGILLLTTEQYRKVNGLSNLFWGWGREDDEMYLRMKEKGMKVYRPEGITTGVHTFRHIHDRQKRKRDQKSFYNQYKMSRTRDRVTGLHDVEYTVVKNYTLTIGGAPLSIFNVEIKCDQVKTPFCDVPSSS